MSFTVQDVVTEARELLLDNLLPYRYSDEYIVRKVNQILKRMVIARPDLFTTITNITCVAGSIQSAPSDSVRLMDVLTNSAGVAVKEINQEVLDLMFPNWGNGAAGPATNWMRYPRDPNRFYLYPVAAGGETLEIVYARCLPTYTASGTVGIQDAYFPVVLDGVCWMMESLDAEHVESGRAKMFRDSYDAALGAGLVARRITDTSTGGLPQEEVA